MVYQEQRSGDVIRTELITSSRNPIRLSWDGLEFCRISHKKWHFAKTNIAYLIGDTDKAEGRMDFEVDCPSVQ